MTPLAIIYSNGVIIVGWPDDRELTLKQFQSTPPKTQEENYNAASITDGKVIVNEVLA